MRSVIAIGSRRPPVPFQWRGNHHLYHGIWIAAFGLFNWYMGIDNGELETLIPFWQFLVCIGVFAIFDDLYEHLICGDSPLRIIYEKLIRPWLR